ADGTPADALLIRRDHIFGTYLHGIFDSAEFRSGFLAALCAKKGIPPLSEHFFDLRQYKEEQFDILETAVRQHLDLPFIYRILEEGA
ncbi:MAG: cobyric acid synthase CobQ, partial [Treponema sp.]|nr:cobyric acid synthase CobQ [Treponema sp.]